MLLVAVAVVSVGCHILGGDGGDCVCPCPGIGQRSGAHLPRRGVFAGRHPVFDHGQPHVAPHFCSKFPVDLRDCSIFFDTCRVCGWENKKSFEKSKKGLSKMVEMV